MSTYHIPVKIIYCWPAYQLWNCCWFLYTAVDFFR